MLLILDVNQLADGVELDVFLTHFVNGGSVDEVTAAREVYLVSGGGHP